jgi:arylsulfatase A-like enzyme
LYPTLIEYCELKTQTKLDGISLVPQLNDLSATRAQPVRISSFEGNHAIRSKHWRYIRYRDGSEELYDHRSDAKEHKNLSGKPDLKSIQDRLASYLPTEAAAEVKPIKSREANDENLRQRRKDSGPIGPSP